MNDEHIGSREEAIERYRRVLADLTRMEARLNDATSMHEAAEMELTREADERREERAAYLRRIAELEKALTDKADTEERAAYLRRIAELEEQIQDQARAEQRADRRELTLRAALKKRNSEVAMLKSALALSVEVASGRLRELTAYLERLEARADVADELTQAGEP